jgi:serine/threonine-protein kinase RsbW
MRQMSGEEEVVRLTASPHPFYAQAIRVAVFLMASRLGFDLEQVEDLRIAVDEAWNHAISHSPPQGEVEVEVGVRPQGMRIVISSDITEQYEEPRDISGSFSRLILDAVSDDVRIEHEDGRCRITLSKLKEDAGAGGEPER